MAKTYHHVFADSAKAPDHCDFTPPFMRRPIASASTRRRLTTAG